MISNPSVLAEIRKDWAGVVGLREKIQRTMFASAGMGGLFPTFAADCAHNLPFLHACAVLNEVLRELDSSRRTLGALVKDYAPPRLTWNNYAAIEELVEKRNHLAHESMVLDRADCWRYIGVIEFQLRAWSVII